MTLNRNPQNYFAEVEQAAFAPANLVAGMGHSPDKMLQARILSYPDAHRHRMGVNYDQLPVNKAKCPVNTYHRDGHLRFDDNGGPSPNYEPNSFGGPAEDPRCKDIPWDTAASVVGRYEAKARLIDNIFTSMKSMPEEIQIRQIRHFHQADPEYGKGVAAGLQTVDQKGADSSGLSGL